MLRQAVAGLVAYDVVLVGITLTLDRPCPLSLLIFIGASMNGLNLAVRAISSSESAARLYSNGLNQLSHPRDGLR